MSSSKKTIYAPQIVHRWVVAGLLLITVMVLSLLRPSQHPSATFFIVATISSAVDLLLMCITLSLSFIRRRRMETKDTLKVLLLYIKDFILLGGLYTGFCYAVASFAVLRGYGASALINSFGHWYSFWLRPLTPVDLVSSATVIGIIAVGLFMAYFNHFMVWRISQTWQKKKRPSKFSEVHQKIRNYPRFTDAVFWLLSFLLLVSFIVFSVMSLVASVSSSPILLVGLTLLFTLKYVGDKRPFFVFEGSSNPRNKKRFKFLGWSIFFSAISTSLGFVARALPRPASVSLQIIILLASIVAACVMLVFFIKRSIRAWQNTQSEKVVLELATHVDTKKDDTPKTETTPHTKNVELVTAQDTKIDDYAIPHNFPDHNILFSQKFTCKNNNLAKNKPINNPLKKPQKMNRVVSVSDDEADENNDAEKNGTAVANNDMPSVK